MQSRVLRVSSRARVSLSANADPIRLQVRKVVEYQISHREVWELCGDTPHMQEGMGRHY